jgi:MFS family permease
MALGFAMQGLAPNLTLYLAGWLVTGLGMACGLYEAAFGALGRLYGTHARSAITTLTLFGGFASTIFWPIGALLVETIGWRGVCLTYAALHNTIALPLHEGSNETEPLIRSSHALTRSRSAL